MSILLYFPWIITAIIIIFVVVAVLYILSQTVNAAETAAPPAVTPTPVNTPTPTAPNPNLQYLPQKAYVQAYAPENGIPSNQQPLQVVPQVVPVQQSQNNTLAGLDIGNILSMVIAGGSGLLAKMGLDKAKKAQDTSQENAAMNVKQGMIQQESLKLQYENMPDKGVNITGKPEIQLTEVAKMNDKAVDTATKA